MCMDPGSVMGSGVLRSSGVQRCSCELWLLLHCAPGKCNFKGRSAGGRGWGCVSHFLKARV